MTCSACFQLFCSLFQVQIAQSLHSTPHFLILHLSHSLYVYHHLHKLKLTGYRSVEYLTHSSLLYAFLVLHFLLRGQIELTPSLGICLIKVMHNPARGREREGERVNTLPRLDLYPLWEPQNIFEKLLALFKMQRNATLEMQSMRIKFPAWCQRNIKPRGDQRLRRATGCQVLQSGLQQWSISICRSHSSPVRVAATEMLHKNCTEI